MHKENWYESFFNGIAIQFWQKAITPGYTRSEINFIKNVTSLPDHSNILDAPCGFGRHSLALANEGHSVTAIDISEEYIHFLSEQAKQMQLDLKAVRTDILHYNVEDKFDVALCLGNSFNYFSIEKMKSFISTIFHSLRDGCYFIINTSVLAESILPSLKERNWMQIDDILYMNENIYHADESVLQTNYQFLQNGNTESKTAWHFVYTLAEVKRMLIDAGFEGVNVYSDVALQKYKLGDRQAYLVVEK